MIDPASIITESARRAQSSFPTKVRSETTISYKPTDAPVGAGEGDDASEDEEEDGDEEDGEMLIAAPGAEDGGRGGEVGRRAGGLGVAGAGVKRRAQ